MSIYNILSWLWCLLWGDNLSISIVQLAVTKKVNVKIIETFHEKCVHVIRVKAPIHFSGSVIWSDQLLGRGPNLTSPSDCVFSLIGILHALFSSVSGIQIANEIAYRWWCTSPLYQVPKLITDFVWPVKSNYFKNNTMHIFLFIIVDIVPQMLTILLSVVLSTCPISENNSLSLLVPASLFCLVDYLVSQLAVPACQKL